MEFLEEQRLSLEQDSSVNQEVFLFIQLENHQSYRSGPVTTLPCGSIAKNMPNREKCFYERGLKGKMGTGICLFFSTGK